MKYKKIAVMLLIVFAVTYLCGCDTGEHGLKNVQGIAKLQKAISPDEHGLYRVQYTLPIETTDQIARVFFGDDSTYTISGPCCDEIRKTYANGEVIRFFISGRKEFDQSWDDLLKNTQTQPVQICYERNGINCIEQIISAGFEPEAGTLMESVKDQPLSDPSIDAAVADSAARLTALGYEHTECVYSSRITQRSFEKVLRAFGHDMTDSAKKLLDNPVYMVRYKINSEHAPACFSDCLDVGEASTATFYYDEYGLFSAVVPSVVRIVPTADITGTLTAKQAYEKLPEWFFREGALLVDVYYDLVPQDTRQGTAYGGWTFRFVAPSTLNSLSDEGYEQMLEILGVAGRYIEMECRVNAVTGEVIGGTWQYSLHFIHPYNSEDILTK